MAERGMTQIMPHTDSPGNLVIQTKPLADCGCDRGDVQAMFHSRTDMVIAGGEEYLGLVLEPSEWGRVDDGCRITIVRTSHILSLLPFSFFQQCTGDLIL
jgi:hypothetical protein